MSAVNRRQFARKLNETATKRTKKKEQKKENGGKKRKTMDDEKNVEKSLGENRILRSIYTSITTLLLRIGHLLLLLLLRMIIMIITDYYDYYDE